MNVKRWLLALLLCVVPCLALADGSVINLIVEPDVPYAFEEGAKILEVVFPRTYSSDCAIIRYDGETMMIDGSLSSEKMQERIRLALLAMQVDHIDVAFNSHPHNDHIDGFPAIHQVAPIGKLLLTFPEDYNKNMVAVVAFMQENNVPIEHVSDGQVLTLGAQQEVTLNVMQRAGDKSFTINDQSAMLLLTYGERTILFTGDVENRAQKSYALDPPPCGLKADILKYPHHGQAALLKGFYEAISPELTIMNGALDVMDGGKAFVKKKNLLYLFSVRGLTRMRTDGHIWVVDYLPEDVSL